MPVLHLDWDESADNPLRLWIERPLRERHALQRHPGAVGHAVLRRVIAPWLGDALIARAENATCMLLLPTSRGMPLVSPECDDQIAPPHTDITYERWLVPSLAPRDPALVLRRIARIPPPKRTLLGAATRYWLTAAQLVDDLVTRGCFAPYAGDFEHMALARWSPLYDAQASAHIRMLALAMPGVCRAVIPSHADLLAHRVPEAQPVLTSFIEHMLDRRIRRPLRRGLAPLLNDDDRGIATRWLRRLVGRPRGGVCRAAHDRRS